MAFKFIQCLWMGLVLVFLWNIYSEMHFALHDIRWNSKEIARDVRDIEEGNSEFYKKIFEPITLRK